MVSAPEEGIFGWKQLLNKVCRRIWYVKIQVGLKQELIFMFDNMTKMSWTIKRERKVMHLNCKHVKPQEWMNAGGTLKGWISRFLLDLLWYNTEFDMAPKDLLDKHHDFLFDSAKTEIVVFQVNSRPWGGEPAPQTPTSSVFAIKQRKKKPQMTWKNMPE